jgi:ribosomal protein S18 acetylase RimI-like enzyme
VEDRRATWLSRLATPAANQYVLVAEDAGLIVGLACSYGADDAQWGTLLDNLHVKAARQGGGIGEDLVRQTARWTLAAYPASGLYLGVLEQNVKAQRFYRRLGAEDVGGFTYSPPGGGVVAVRRYAWDTARLKSLAEDD